MGRKKPEILSFLEYNVLLALADEARHGYGVLLEIEEQTGGDLSPRAGSLYRIIGRMVSQALVQEVEANGDPEAHPGLERRYYQLTEDGRRMLTSEARRLGLAAELASEKLRLKGAG